MVSLMYRDQSNFNQPNLSDKKYYRKVVILIIIALALMYASFKTGFATNKISLVNNSGLLDRVAGIFPISQSVGEEEEEHKVSLILTNDDDYVMPKKENNRLDILILGIRGGDDEFAEEGGALLTDTVMIFSYDKKTGKSSLVSLPRDFYVKIGSNYENKINTIYEIGRLRGSSYKFTKELFSKITGVYIDNIIVFDFSSFVTIIDELGGIDIELDKPFIENNQWGFEFTLPTGENHLDGQTALYYVRSRFSSSDFDRSIRQQQVISAIKNKASNLNLIKDPITSLSIINSLTQNIDTDINIWDVNTIITLATEIDLESNNLTKYIITTNNLVYETFHEGIYILLPNGNNFNQIKETFQGVIN